MPLTSLTCCWLPLASWLLLAMDSLLTTPNTYNDKPCRTLCHAGPQGLSQKELITRGAELGFGWSDDKKCKGSVAQALRGTSLAKAIAHVGEIWGVRSVICTSQGAKVSRRVCVCVFGGA